MKACRGSPFVFNLFCSLAMFKIHEVDEKEGTKEGCFHLNKEYFELYQVGCSVKPFTRLVRLQSAQVKAVDVPHKTKKMPRKKYWVYTTKLKVTQEKVMAQN